MPRIAFVLTLAICSTPSLAQQTTGQIGSARAPQGAFVGVLKNALDSLPIRAADVRLFRIDSTQDGSAPNGVRSTEIFIDSLHPRIAVTDSTGYFAVWRIPPGRYVMQARRIGFSPAEAFVSVDSTTVMHDFSLDPIPSLLSKVEIREAASTSLSRQLDHVGFLNRQKFHAIAATYATPGDIDRYKLQTVGDIFLRYGLYSYDTDILFDRVPVGYSDIQDYPADMIAGVEIYRRQRPVEFNGLRFGPTLLDTLHVLKAMSRPLIVIWTYVP